MGVNLYDAFQGRIKQFGIAGREAWRLSTRANSERCIDQLTAEWPVSFGAFPTAIRRFEFRGGNIGLPFPGNQASMARQGATHDITMKTLELHVRYIEIRRNGLN